MSDTILIVDDEPVQRRLLENAVQKLGYQTLLAESGEEALEKLNQQNSRVLYWSFLILLCLTLMAWACWEECAMRA